MRTKIISLCLDDIRWQYFCAVRIVVSYRTCKTWNRNASFYCSFDNVTNGFLVFNSDIFEVSITVAFEMVVESIGIPAVERILRLDYSQANFFVDSEGKRANYPHYYRVMEERLAREQRKLSRMVKGSKRWEHQRLVVAKLMGC
ncbi:Hypothetical protein Tpal_790 [Trichococcus palustris]|jgi:transposase|uniref:Uncharacterized protein n=1 Tax=Trichococcus palustris TaxID=140314 RepID=A0A143YDZ9_9LACT|nr:Hypothetical protein Tpal_790 [Trichococcus palustris]SFK81056.1 hypothetical protein SAMN04488076_105171 [Trichococcus palustris]